MTKAHGTGARAAAIVLVVAGFAFGCGGTGESGRGDTVQEDAAGPGAKVGDATAADAGGADARGDAAPAVGDASAPGGPGVSPDAAVSEMEPVSVYFPAEDGLRLAGESRTIFKTPQPGDRAKQIVAALLEGPQAEGSSRAVPEATELRQLFVLDDGTAWADFSAALRDNLAGGSTSEILAVYAIVDSIVLNVPEIARVGILVEGRPVESLNGHVDLRRALPPRRDLLAVTADPAKREGASEPEAPTEPAAPATPPASAAPPTSATPPASAASPTAATPAVAAD